MWTARAHALGETWLGTTLVTYTPESTITGDLAAQLVCVPEYEIRRWAAAPHPDDPQRRLLPRAGRRGRRQTYLVADVLDAAAALRRTRRRADP